MATGIGNLPYTMPPVSPFDVITSQAENERIANIKALADGTGIGDKAITAPKIDFATFADYSMSELNTGIKWVDGKTIYKKTINFGALPNTSNKNVPHSIVGTISSVISIDGIASSGTVFQPINNAFFSNLAIAAYVNGANIVITTFQNYSSFSAYVTLTYTKV